MEASENNKWIRTVLLLEKNLRTAEWYDADLWFSDEFNAVEYNLY